MELPVAVGLLLPRDGDHEAVVAGGDGARGVVDHVIFGLVGLIVLLHLNSVLRRAAKIIIYLVHNIQY